MADSKSTESEAPLKPEEPLDEGEIRVLEVIKRFPKGITDHDLTLELPDLLPEERVTIFNSLLSRGCLDLYHQGGNLMYKSKEPNKTEVVKGADNEEKVVYSIIEAAGNKGIWIRDIRYQSNLLPNQLHKIVKGLENKKVIKAVKSVSVSYRWLMMPLFFVILM